MTVVVPLGYVRVRTEDRVEDDVSIGDVAELPAGVVEVHGRVEVSEHPAQTVTVVAQSRPQTVTVDVTVLASSC